MIDVLAMGELLIDFVSVATGVSLKDSPGFTKAPGGAPANVAVGVRRLGRTSGFIGKVGNDDFGVFLWETLAREGVETRGVRYDDRARTMLAFVSLRPDGEREFMFYRHPSADMLLEPSEVDVDLLTEARVFHHGSISLITEPSRSATLAAVRAARAAGALISYDPNIRLPLWPAPNEARAVILAAASSADIIKVSEEELAFLTGTDDIAEGVGRLRTAASSAAGPAKCAIVVTRGRKGCVLALDNSGPVTVRDGGQRGGGGLWLEVPGFGVQAVDTTGAGDAFVAGLLVGIIEEATGCNAAAAATAREKLRALGEAEWRRVLTLANAVGALCTTKYGAIPALPTMQEVRAFLNEWEKRGAKDANG
ncbi:MAG: PfkB family carbohydrate kinase [Betaproteobacteria bacterium]